MNQTPDFLVEALKALVPKAQFISFDGKLELLNWTDERPKPSDKQINDKIAELQADYDAKQYQRDRAVEYPSIEDQLDEIFHKGLTEWKKTIQAVKDKHPKPTE